MTFSQKGGSHIQAVGHSFNLHIEYLLCAEHGSKYTKVDVMLSVLKEQITKIKEPYSRSARAIHDQ